MKNKLFAIVLLSSISVLTSCQNSEVLSPEPSVFDLDSSAPTCPGMSTLSVSSGPSLTLEWAQGSDGVSESSKITYSIFMRQGSNTYDLVSPTKIVVGATSTLISSGIAVGQTYTLFVQCKDEAGNSFPTGPTNEMSVSVSDAQAPSKVLGLTATGASTTSINLVWSPSDDGAGGTTASNMRYKVYSSSSPTVSTSGSYLSLITGGVTSYTHGSLNPNTTMYYKVVALDENSNASIDSDEVSATTVDDSTAPVFSPNSGIAVTGTSATTIDLSWNSATDNVTSTMYPQYKLYRCTGSTSCNPFAGSIVATLSKSTTTYQDTSLTASTIYVYGITAFDYRNNNSTNTDSVISNTLYSSSGYRYAYPTLREAGSRFGAGVSIANVYGPSSGHPDLIVGAPTGSQAGSVNQYTGCVHIFEGISDGQFGTTPVRTFCDPSPPANGTTTSNGFGTSITKGDFNADGYMDLAISAPNDAAAGNAGKVYIYYTELAGSNIQLTSSPSFVSRAAPVGNDGFGYGLCSGNLDGVGADDLVVVSPTEQCAANQCGRILIYKIGNSPYSVPSSPSLEINPWSHPGTDLIDLGFSGNASEQGARSCVVGNFDSSNSSQQQIVLGSGILDAGATDNNEGAVYFIRLLNTTLAGTGDYSIIQALVDGVALSTSVWPGGTYFGDTLHKVQNSSGIDRLLVGAPYDSSIGTQNGAVYSFSIQQNAGKFDLIRDAEVYLGREDLDRNGMGSGIGIFDRDNDGNDDLLSIGSFLDDGTSVPGATDLDIGQVFTYQRPSGSSTFPSSVVQTGFDYSYNDVRSNQLFGGCLASGDLNGDGELDMVIGAPYQQYDPTNLVKTASRGVVYIYYGQGAGELDFDNPDQMIFGPNVANTSFGLSCDVMDFNGDTQVDLLVGAPFRDSGATNRGSVYVYYGTVGSDLTSSASYTLAPPTGDTATASLYFGSAMTHGDWDGDGYEDLAISAVGKNSGAADQGRVWVYFADTTTHAIRTGSTPLVINPPVTQATLRFGLGMFSFRTQLGSAATSRDLVICAPNYTIPISHFGTSIPAAIQASFGICWVYNGSTTPYTISGNSGTDNSPDSQIRYPYNLTGQTNATIHFGSASTVGDWDNDGVDDAVICASRHRAISGTQNGTTNAGVCFGFRGKSDGTGGFQAYANYLGTDVPNGQYRFSNENPESSTVSYFGGSGDTGLIGGGVLLIDVNNNSRDDLVVGEPYSDNLNPSNSSVGLNSGRVYIDRGNFTTQP